MNRLFDQASERVHHLAQTIETHTHTIPLLGVLTRATRAFTEDRCSMVAAALSYYAILSVFPLMLFLMTVASLFMPPDRVARTVAGFFSANLPFSSTVLQTNLQEAAKLRGTLTIAAALGFLWTAAGVFDLLQLGLNRAFRVTRHRPMWRQRIVSVGMVTGVSLLFGVSLGTTTLVRLGVRSHLIQRHDLWVDAILTGGTLLLSVIVFGLLYRFGPYDRIVRWRNVWLGAFVASILWEIAKLVFALYLTDYAALDSVYGSVGAIISIMLWSYITALIFLFGAEIAAVQSGARAREKTGDEWWALTA